MVLFRKKSAGFEIIMWNRFIGKLTEKHDALVPKFGSFPFQQGRGTSFSGVQLIVWRHQHSSNRDVSKTEKPTQWTFKLRVFRHQLQLVVCCRPAKDSTHSFSSERHHAGITWPSAERSRFSKRHAFRAGFRPVSLLEKEGQGGFSCWFEVGDVGKPS